MTKFKPNSAYQSPAYRKAVAGTMPSSTNLLLAYRDVALLSRKGSNQRGRILRDAVDRFIEAYRFFGGWVA